MNDETSAKLMVAFHRGMTTPGISRAEVLRRAQVELIGDECFRHPRFWAAFLLLSSWP